MNPALVPSFAPSSRAAGAPGGRSQTGDGGFRDMLDGSPAGHGRQNNVGPNALTSSPTDRSADLPSDAAHDQGSEPVQDGDRKTAEGAKRVSRDRDGEREDDADRGEAFLWFDMRMIAAERRLHMRTGAASESPASPALAADAVTANTGQDAPAAESEQQAATAVESQAAQPAMQRRSSAEIAAILDGDREVPPSMEDPANEPSAGFSDTAQSTDVEFDKGNEVRVLSDPSRKANSGNSAIQQMPFGSAVAMLNLMAQGSSANDMKSGAGPTTGDSTSKGKAQASLDADESLSLLETSSNEPTEIATRKSARATVEAPSERPNADREARNEFPDADQDSSQPTLADKPIARMTETPVAARLGTTAASVVETLASTPPLKAAQAVSELGADTTTVSHTTHSLKIQLRPVELGEITATLRMNGDTISVEMATEKIEAYERLNVDSDAIVKALRGLGLQVDQVTIQPPQVATAASRPEGGMQNQTSNGSNQQFAETGHSAGGNSDGQRGTASQGGQRNGPEARHPASPANENRLARGLVI